MGKALLLHLLAVAAGWGIVVALAPVVPAGWIGGPGAAESHASAKSAVRTLTPADAAAGQKLLQRVTAALPKESIEANKLDHSLPREQQDAPDFIGWIAAGLRQPSSSGETTSGCFQRTE